MQTGEESRRSCQEKTSEQLQGGSAWGSLWSGWAQVRWAGVHLPSAMSNPGRRRGSL